MVGFASESGQKGGEEVVLVSVSVQTCLLAFGLSGPGGRRAALPFGDPLWSEGGGEMRARWIKVLLVIVSVLLLYLLFLVLSKYSIGSFR